MNHQRFTHCELFDRDRAILKRTCEQLKARPLAGSISHLNALYAAATRLR